MVKVRTPVRALNLWLYYGPIEQGTSPVCRFHVGEVALVLARKLTDDNGHPYDEVLVVVSKSGAMGWLDANGLEVV